LVTPGCTRAQRLRGSIATTALRRARPRITPLPSGSAPPESPVPAPRATTGTPRSLHTRNTACISSMVRGNATASGSWRNAVSPSHSYGFRSVFRCSSASAGSVRASAAISSACCAASLERSTVIETDMRGERGPRA